MTRSTSQFPLVITDLLSKPLDSWHVKAQSTLRVTPLPIPGTTTPQITQSPFLVSFGECCSKSDMIFPLFVRNSSENVTVSISLSTEAYAVHTDTIPGISLLKPNQDVKLSKGIFNHDTSPQNHPFDHRTIQDDISVNTENLPYSLSPSEVYAVIQSLGKRVDDGESSSLEMTSTFDDSLNAETHDLEKLLDLDHTPFLVSLDPSLPSTNLSTTSTKTTQDLSMSDDIASDSIDHISITSQEHRHLKVSFSPHRFFPPQTRNHRPILFLGSLSIFLHRGSTKLLYQTIPLCGLARSSVLTIPSCSHHLLVQPEKTVHTFPVVNALTSKNASVEASFSIDSFSVIQNGKFLEEHTYPNQTSVSFQSLSTAPLSLDHLPRDLESVFDHPTLSVSPKTSLLQPSQSVLITLQFHCPWSKVSRFNDAPTTAVLHGHLILHSSPETFSISSTHQDPLISSIPFVFTTTNNNAQTSTQLEESSIFQTPSRPHKTEVHFADSDTGDEKQSSRTSDSPAGTQRYRMASDRQKNTSNEDDIQLLKEIRSSLTEFQELKRQDSELERQREQERMERKAEEQRKEEAKRRQEEEDRRWEREEEEHRVEEEKRRLETERRRIDEERRESEKERSRLEKERRRLEEERQRDEERKLAKENERAKKELREAEELKKEKERLRDELESMKKKREEEENRIKQLKREREQIELEKSHLELDLLNVHKRRQKPKHRIDEDEDSFDQLRRTVENRDPSLDEQKWESMSTAFVERERREERKSENKPDNGKERHKETHSDSVWETPNRSSHAHHPTLSHQNPRDSHSHSNTIRPDTRNSIETEKFIKASEVSSVRVGRDSLIGTPSGSIEMRPTRQKPANRMSEDVDDKEQRKREHEKRKQDEHKARKHEEEKRRAQIMNDTRTDSEEERFQRFEKQLLSKIEQTIRREAHTRESSDDKGRRTSHNQRKRSPTPPESLEERYQKSPHKVSPSHHLQFSESSPTRRRISFLSETSDSARKPHEKKQERSHQPSLLLLTPLVDFGTVEPNTFNEKKLLFRNVSSRTVDWSVVVDQQFNVDSFGTVVPNLGEDFMFTSSLTEGTMKSGETMAVTLSYFPSHSLGRVETKMSGRVMLIWRSERSGSGKGETIEECTFEVRGECSRKPTENSIHHFHPTSPTRIGNSSFRSDRSTRLERGQATVPYYPQPVSTPSIIRQSTPPPTTTHYSYQRPPSRQNSFHTSPSRFSPHRDRSPPRHLSPERYSNSFPSHPSVQFTPDRFQSQPSHSRPRQQSPPRFEMSSSRHSSPPRESTFPRTRSPPRPSSSHQPSSHNQYYSPRSNTSSLRMRSNQPGTRPLSPSRASHPDRATSPIRFYEQDAAREAQRIPSAIIRLQSTTGKTTKRSTKQGS
ncbi:hypothetical protein BLNAU_1486 [Blattamonas nauphoetae]|uniref:Abnormal spindle-like microcephaly-associated protein ASH domain-containing protein n=1 Tax=Blattamonas nauphoetae TaxID=2049346 RepID=A0ABQ9YI67_9EUKA|nr:hypothetical protein BLNAU_1486 [Blattamonas nauphoetae]